MIKDWYDFYSGDEKQALNNLWIDKAKILLANNRLVGLELEDATKAAEYLGFQVYVVIILKAPGYDLIGAVYYQREVMLYINEGETTVLRATHGGVY